MCNKKNQKVEVYCKQARLNTANQIICYLIIFVAEIIFSSQNVMGATYYIDSQGGDDSQSGLTTELAWKTIEKVNGTSFLPGDSILFKRNCIWREQLIIPSSGTLSSPITFGTYGTGNNPVIYRTNLFSSSLNNLWQDSLIHNGSGEAYSGNINDSSTDLFKNWGNMIDGGTSIIEAVNDCYEGDTAISLYRDGSNNVWIHQTFSASPATTYYLEFYGKKGDSSIGNVEIKDTTNGLWLQNDGSWGGCVSITALSVSESSWTKKSLSFTTSSSTSSIQVRFFNSFGTGNIYLDSMYLNEGDHKLNTNIWAGSIYSLPNELGTGAIDNGVRVPNYQHDESPSSIENGYFWCPSGTSPRCFYYRKDSGMPESLEVGARQYAIYINNVHDIKIENIDVYGSGHDSLIKVYGSSYNITIDGAVISHGNGVGIWAENTTSNIIYSNLTVHNNGNTGIYMNSDGGLISNCKSYDNGRIITDKSDRGGIASYQGGNIIIENNEAYHNGPDDQIADFEISVVGAIGPFTVIGNYAHECIQGGIHFAEGGESSVIAYNKVNGFGTCSEQNTSPGYYAGIRLGGGIGGDLSDILVCNNIIANGDINGQGTAGINAGVSNSDIENLTIKNNIFYNNSCPDLIISNITDSNTFDFDNNIYYKSNYNGNWSWAGTFYDTLSAWNTVSGQDGNSLTSDPLFINAEDGDFHLSYSSPAIDNGINLDFTEDFEGTPVGSTPDIGPYENRFADSLLANGNFEGYTGTIDDLTTDSFTSWGKIIDGGTSRVEAVSELRDGNAAVGIYRDGSYSAWIYQSVPVDSSTTYYLEFYGMKDGNSAGYVQIKDTSNGLWLQNDGTWGGCVSINALSVTGSSWTKKSLSFTTSSSTSIVQIRFFNSSGTGYVYLDDVCLVAE